MSDCEQVEIVAKIETTFNGCREHGHFEPTSGYLEAPGVSVPQVIDASLMVVIESIAAEVVKVPKVQSLLSYSREWEWSTESEQLPDRAKRRVLRLLAKQMLLERVAGGRYMRDVAMSSIALPLSFD